MPLGLHVKICIIDRVILIDKFLQYLERYVLNITLAYKEGAEAIKKYGKNVPWRSIINKHIDDFMQEAAESLKITKQEFAQKIDKAGLAALLTNIFYETFIGQEFDEENIITDYLKKRRWKHSKTTVTCLEQVRDRFFSIYEVTKVKPGKSITVKDYLFKTKIIEVIEHLVSNCITSGDYIIGKVIEVEGKYFFAGCVVPTTFDYAEWVREELKVDFKDEDIPITQYKKYELIPLDLCLEFKPLLETYIFSMFITSLAYMVSPPQIVNNKGQEIKVTHVNFKIKDKSKVLEALSKEEYFDRDDNSDLWIWFEEVKEKGGSLPIGSRRILAQITIKKDKLICTTTSEARTKSCIELVQRLMGDFIGMPVLEYEDIFS